MKVIHEGIRVFKAGNNQQLSVNRYWRVLASLTFVDTFKGDMLIVL